MRAAVVLAVLAVPALARADVHGHVVDGDGRAIAGATVDAGAAGTAVTGDDGAFVLAAAGDVDAIVVADEYLPAVVTLEDDARVVLSPDSSDGEVIHVSGKPPDMAEPTEYTLDAEMVRRLPGAANDVLRAVQSLPGVGRNAYNLGGLVLRGTNPIDADVFLDGIEVPIAFHFGGLSSFYPSTLLDDLRVLPGGPDVDRSRNLGGVVELTSRAPRRDRVRIGAELGLLDASTFAEAPTFGGGAIAIGVRRSYVDAILAAILPRDEWVLPSYYDGQLRWDLPLAGGTLSSLVFFSDDEVRVTQGGGGGFDQYFARAALRWQRRAGANRWMALLWGGENSLGVETAPDDPEDTHYYRNPFGARAELRRAVGWGELGAGLDLQGSRVKWDSTEIGTGDTEPGAPPRWVADVGLWTEARVRLGDGALTLKPGVRADYFGTANLWRVDPRAVATHELAPWLTLRETLGVHHVAPGAFAVFEDIAKHDDTARSYHASIGAQVRAGGWETSGTWFHYQSEGPTPRSPVYDPNRDTEMETTPVGSATVLEILLSNALGEELGGPLTTRARSHGFELSAQRRTEHWILWLAYTYSRAERNEWGSADGWLPFTLDQTHDVSAVASVALGAWQLGARFRGSTGVPYTPVLGVSVIGQETTQIVGPPLSQRLPAFLSLDLRVDRRWRRSWGTVAVFLDVQNVTNRWNPESVGYDEDGFRHYARGLPVLPMFGVSLEPP